MAANITVLNGDITLKQGTTGEVRYVLKSGANPIDVTGWAMRMMARKTFDDALPIISKSTAAGSITMTPAIGLFVIPFSPTDTSAIRFSGDTLEAVYDVEVIDSTAQVYRIAEGAFTISREVTR